MKPIKLRVNTRSQKYPIVIGPNLISKIQKIISKNSNKKYFILTSQLRVGFLVLLKYLKIHYIIIIFSISKKMRFTTFSVALLSTASCALADE